MHTSNFISHASQRGGGQALHSAKFAGGRVSWSAVGKARDLLAPSIVAPPGGGLRWLFTRKFGLGGVPESGSDHRNPYFQRFAPGIGVFFARSQKRGQAFIEPAGVHCTVLEIGFGENSSEKSGIGPDSRDLQFFESPG